LNGHVFISYARSDDEPFVLRLRDSLQGHDINVWWDRQSMESRGRTFLQELRDAIEASERVIAVIGSGALRSAYVRAEWEHALLFCKGVLPIIRDGDYERLPPELATLHCVDFRAPRDYGRALNELCDKLGEPVPPLGPLRTAVPAPPPHFDARREELAAIADLVLADVRRPIVVTAARQVTALHGMGGTGKSVLAAAFARSADARRAFSDGIAWLPIGRHPDLLHATRVMAAGFPDADLQKFTSLDVALSLLTQLLNDRVCLVVLDDVWDVDCVAPFHAVLSSRSRLLLTTRDASVATNSGSVAHEVGVLVREASLRLLARWCNKSDLPPTATAVADECGDLPLAIAMVGAMLSGKDERWDNVLHKLRTADLEKIARQFPNYPYPNLFRAIEVSVEALDERERQCYLRLAVFPEQQPIPEVVLRTLWSVDRLDDYDVQDVVDTLVDRALLRHDAVAGVILHDLQFDYISKQAADLPALQHALLSAYRARVPGGRWFDIEDDGYIHDRLTWHLEMAGLTEDLHGLLAAGNDRGESAWWSVREKRGHTAGFLADVARAWKLADAAANKNASDHPAAALGRQVTCALIRSSINSLAGNLPATLLTAAVAHGVISRPQALAYSRQNTNPHARIWSLVGLLPQATEEERRALLTEGLAVARRIDDPLLRVHGAALLLPHLPEPERHSLLVDALHLAKGSAVRRTWPDTDDYLREQSLAVLARYLTPSTVADALEVARRIWGDDHVKAKALAHLAPHVPAAADELIAMARSIKVGHSRADGLIACIRHFEAARQPAVLAAALEGALEHAAVSADTAALLEELAPLLPRPLLEQALTAVLGIRDERYRTQSMAAIAPSAAAPDYPRLVEAVAALEDRGLQAWALGAIAASAPPDQRPTLIAAAIEALQVLDGEDLATTLMRLAANVTDEQAAVLVAAARTLGDDEARHRTLISLYDALPSARTADVLRDALTAGRAIDFDRLRLEALCAVARRQPSHEAATTWHEALSMAATLDAFGADDALHALLDHVPDALLPRALETAGANAGFRGRMLSLVAPRLDAGLLRQAVEMARGIRDTAVLVEAAAGLLPHLEAADAESRARRLIGKASDIADRGERADVLAGIAAHVSASERAAICRTVLETSNDATAESRRARAIGRLASVMPDALTDEAVQAVRTLAFSGDRVKAMAAVTSRLPADARLQILRDELAAAVSAKGTDRELLEHFIEVGNGDLARDVLQLVRRDAQDLGPADARSLESLLLKIAPLIEDPERDKVIDEAWSAAVWAEYPLHLDSADYVNWMCSMSPYWTADRRAQVLRAARSIGDREVKVRTLARISRHAAAEERESLADEAIAEAEAIPDAVLRALRLAHWAWRLPQERLGALLKELKAVTNPDQRVEALIAIAAQAQQPERLVACTLTLAALADSAEARVRKDGLLRLTPIAPAGLLAQVKALAEALPDGRDRVEVLFALVSRVEGPAWVEVMMKAFSAALHDWAPGRHETLHRLATAAAASDAALPLWVHALHEAANQPRSTLASDLASLAPLVLAIGGREGIGVTLDAVETVAQWWP
jgi:hypothetical protein